MDSDKIAKVLKTVKRTSGVKAKKQILKDFPELKQYIKYAFDTEYRYHITLPKMRAEQWPVPMHTGMRIQAPCFKFLDKLRSGEISGATALHTAHNLRNTLAPESAELFTHILNRTLRIGLNTKSINQVWPNCLFDFTVMLASQYEKAKHKLIYPCYSSMKIDGVRAIYNKGTFYSRTGKVYEGLNHIAEQLQNTCEANIILDGELVVPDTTFQTSCGLIRNMYDTPKAIYQIFDAPCDLILTDRLDIVEQYVLSLHKASNVRFIPHTFIYNESEAIKAFNTSREAGYEGIVLKNTESLYQKKRSTDWVKLKNVSDISLKVIDTFPGKGRLANNMIGGVVAELPNGNTVEVGSGFTDVERTLYHSNPQLIIGAIIDIQYHELTPDGSLREPRFKGVRYDKPMPDSELPLT